MLRTSIVILAGLFTVGTAMAQETDPSEVVSKRDQLDAQGRALRQGSTMTRHRKPAPIPAAALPADIVAGRAISDSAGVPIGTIDALRPTGVVLASPLGKVEVAIEAIRKNDKGLFLVISKPEFETLMADARTRRLAAEKAESAQP